MDIECLDEKSVEDLFSKLNELENDAKSLESRLQELEAMEAKFLWDQHPKGLLDEILKAKKLCDEVSIKIKAAIKGILWALEDYNIIIHEEELDKNVMTFGTEECVMPSLQTKAVETIEKCIPILCMYKISQESFLMDLKNMFEILPELSILDKLILQIQNAVEWLSFQFR